MFDWFWYHATQRDPRVVDLFSRHYSSKKNGVKKDKWLAHGIAGPGETLTLLTCRADALFVWKVSLYRMDGLSGIECTVFRNESDVLSSKLILEAETLARKKWDIDLLFTYVSAPSVLSSNPGYCFQCAGWQKSGESQAGLILLTKSEAM